MDDKRNSCSLEAFIEVVLTALFVSVMAGGCQGKSRITAIDREPVIYPDYSGVTVPVNVAPLNFVVSEEGDRFIISLRTSEEEIRIISNDSIIGIPLQKWKKLMKHAGGKKIGVNISVETGERLIQFKTVFIHVVADEMDPWVCYRLLYPGYESWGEMQIIQRSVEDFRRHILAGNSILGGSCINCHTFLQSDAEKYFIHVRGNKAGTYFVDNKRITRTELRTDGMPGNAVYPSWHPSGRYIAFSSNRIHSVINMKPGENMELYDRASIVVLYDIVSNSIIPWQPDSTDYMSTHPCWTPDGKYLYFCRTDKLRPGFNYREIRYDLYRMPFDPERGTFGVPELVFNAKAIKKSTSFPVVSPDGQSVIFTLHDYGTFPGWHKEADLFYLDLTTLKELKLNLNSSDTESFAAWSSEGRWLVFSSKRDDGFNSRLYFAYIRNDGSTAKPFMLPEKDPTLSGRLIKSYNRPQMTRSRIKTGPRDFEAASRKTSLQAKRIED